MVTITRAVCTCLACPSQWDAWDEQGNYYYLRYRNGHGTMRKYRSQEDFGDITRSALAADFRHGDPLDGFITLPDFCALAGVALNLG